MSSLDHQVDWGFWNKFENLKLGEAICLSEGICPKICKSDFRSPFNTFDRPSKELNMKLRDKLDLAISYIRVGKLKVQFQNKAKVTTDAIVNLAEFAVWLKHVGYDIPEKFPTSGCFINSENSLVLKLPHRMPFIEKLVSIANDHFENGVMSSSSNQNQISAEITEQCFGKPSEPLPSQAKVIAARLRPIELMDKKVKASLGLT